MRTFVCGDIHGMFDELMAALDAVGFDKSADRLIALGDMVDRGPKSLEVLRLLDEPWFDSIMGNHEEMMLLAANPRNREAQGHHLMNGGGWFSLLDQTERDWCADTVRSLPLALTVVTPTGRTIGLVHADFPGTRWHEFASQLSQRAVREYALWSRERVQEAKHHDIAPAIGVDHVYFGHTPMKTPLRSQNMSWIDTGCFATGNLTVEELV